MNPPHSPVVEARALDHRYGRVAALRGVELAVGPGEVVLLMGPNGAGKSTLLRTLAGLSRPTRGQVRVGGRDLRHDRGARAAIGFLSHQTLLYDDLTARENLRFAATLHGLIDAASQVRDALDAAGLTPRADSRAGSLSHGLRQRLAIARATIHAPRLLLLDEPFSGLDARAADLLRDTIRRAASTSAVICATHQAADLWSLATRVVLLHHGAITLDAARPATLDAFVDHYQRTLAA